ncbi:hypothetical protein P154DRAFT_516689 [Amniculicola lignicola CBS 123094]|uniref:Uncharacterized protein n=1 Tax=Amniculicola lignicola CBS 123094 TaxID=1392246 RepID=A0A6A5X4Q8_9PLEO|nr:hypothetical protein P154DRAFT_516689 [Amniculicola lignicola CBS 123094]
MSPQRLGVCPALMRILLRDFPQMVVPSPPAFEQSLIEQSQTRIPVPPVLEWWSTKDFLDKTCEESIHV